MGNVGLFMCSDLGRCVTGTTVCVNNVLNVMDMALDSKTMNTDDRIHLLDF